MPRIVAEIPTVARTKRRKIGRPAKYPYRTMFDGNLREFTQGKDFDIKPSRFSRVVRAYARNHGLSDGLTIAVRGRKVYVHRDKSTTTRTPVTQGVW